MNAHSIDPGQIQRPFGVALSVNVVALLFLPSYVSPSQLWVFPQRRVLRYRGSDKNSVEDDSILQARDDPCRGQFRFCFKFHCGKWLSLWPKVTIAQAATGVYGFLRLSFSESDIGLHHKHSLSCLFTVSRLLASRSKLMRSLSGVAS